MTSDPCKFPKRPRIFALCCLITSVILVAFISGGSTKKSDLRLQSADCSSAIKSALPSTGEITELRALNLDSAKYIARDSGPQSSRFNNHAAALPFSGTPYTGTAISLPGRIEAENFDNGGEAVAYHDTTSTNDGGSYRSEGVDICGCGSPYGLSVGWTQPGEWMEYTVSVATYGSYKFQTLTATTVSGTAIHVEVDGTNVTSQITLPNTGAWGSYAATSSSPVTLTAGQHIVRVVVEAGGFLFDSVDVIRLNSPYGGTATALPGTVPAENFDNGGEGVAYHDTTATNDGGAYRSEGVDLCGCAYANGAALGWSQAGEWTRYTVNFSTTDTYTLQARMSTIISSAVIHLEVDGTNVTGQMALPNTGAWDAWTTISKPNVQISAGQHDLKMVIESGGFLLDSLSAIPSVPSAPSALTATAVSTTQINLAWADNSFNESGFKIERKTGPSGSYSEIATTAAGATSFSNTGLQPSTQYFYRLRATNLGGDSAYSNEASAMTSNLLPSVSVTAPTAGTVFTAPASVTINASASDSDGTISKVEFFQGATKLGEDLSAPYSFSWTNVAAASYSLTARATDNLGGVTTSAPVSITVNALPTTSLTSPAANTVFNSPANVTINASASDSDGTISKVEFFQNGALLGEDTTSPYSYVWTNAPIGTFSLTARATDDRNATTNSSGVTIIVNNPPSVSITAPAANSSFVVGSTVSIAATSSDTDGTISKVEFYQGATKLGEDTTSPFTFDWANVQQGSYSLSAKATDDRGALTTSAAVSINVAGNSVARLDPMNRTGGGGEDPLSRNFNWNLPLVNLPGRAGLDLSLSLSYNALVWTKSGNVISFDDDRGFPSPGFRLGFPTIQTTYLNGETGKWSYLLIGSDGSRTELRRVTATSDFYESADSSYLLLDTTNLTSSDPRMILRTTDGTQLTYKLKGSAYECTEIKDRNGNYVTINYNSSGRIANIHDTLDRVITFNYDNGLLSTIRQEWKRQPPNETQVITHTWASFAYEDLTIQTNFDANLTVVGVVNNAAKVLSSVTLDDNSDTLADNSHVDFSYTPFGQVWKISSLAADDQWLNQRTYKLPKSDLWTNSPVQTDCPRFTERRDWGRWVNGDTDGTPALSEDIVTTFSGTSTANWDMPDDTEHHGVSVQVTAPDGTFEKIYFADTVGTAAKGWLRGLPELVESFDVGGTVAQRQVFTSWEQDDETVSYELNPRLKESAIYDPALEHPKLTRITYQVFTPPTGSSYKLPRDVFEYDKDASTVLRSTRTDYVDGDDTIKAPYLSRRICGLVKEKKLYQGDVTDNGVLLSRVGFSYDESGSIQGSDAPVQHDNTDYAANFVTGRGNVSTVTRYDVLVSGASTSAKLKYNTAGAVVSSKNALDKEVKIEYADSFSDNNNSRGTFAYPTAIIDPDNFYSTTKYNFDFGSITYRQTPPPNATAQPSPSPTPVGPAQTFSYDDLGRLERTKNLVNNAYTRYQYPASKIRVETFSTLVAGKGEAYSFKILDGFGRTIASASDHPSTTGTSARFDAQRMAYDVMGRVIKTSNPAETSAIGNDPAGWQLVEGDAGSNWFYTQYTYDWKGRPKITANTDGTTKSATYEGCGCAGGEVVTLNDEGTIVNGANGASVKTRQKKIYTDVLGRTVKTEVWNFEGTGPGGNGRALYSTTVTTYNVRDQVTLVRQYKGAPPSNYLTDLSCPTGTCQKTELTYDGYGRLQTKHEPAQQQNPYVSTSWTYNADDTVNTITDGRGAVTTYGYGTTGNNRRLVETISHSLSGSLPITTTYGYDVAGNRKSMTHSINDIQQDKCDYTYDQLSRLTSEKRHINALENSATAGDYTIGYQYTLGGQVSSVTDPFDSTTNLNYDAVGRTESVTGSYGGVNHTYAGDIEYRAWGAVKRHGAQTITYNTRLQPTQFRFFQYRYDYNYHPDGSLKHLIDLDDVVGQPSQVTFHYMSRNYEYDLAGRLTGVDATDNPLVNGGIVPAPFVGYYGYDEFNNLNSRSGHYALNTDTGDSGTYVDNKRTNNGWSYDADGRVLTSADTATSTSQTWTYDAAGNQIGISEVSSGTTTTNTLSYDGDGALLYESVTTPQTTKADYLIRSTVLGAALTKLDALGNKDITYVPANGLSFTMQTKDSNGNPTVGGVWRDVTGLQEDGKAVDPFGALIENVQPPTSGPPPNMPFYGGTYGGVSWSQFTNANNYSSGCTLDGARTTCQNVLHQLGRGNADLISLSTTGTLADFLNILGTVPRSVTHSRYVPNSNAPPDHSNDPDRGDVIVTNIDEKLPGHWEYWEEYSGSEQLNDPSPASHQDPQDTLPPDLKARVQDIGDNCTSFLNQFFDALGSKVHSRDLGTLFDRVKKIEISSEAFEKYDQPRDAAGFVTWFGGRQIFVRPAAWYNSPNYQQFRWNAIANTVVAELMHHARTTGTFSDRNLDRAALKIMDDTEKSAAVKLMKSKGYRAGVVGHSLVIKNCRSTNPYGPPPKRNLP